jgi:putative phosphoserine phosphatase/1-acylglycerol-3-phosphate O-acyltransferase
MTGTRAPGAAFFDLDRTLLAGASGEVFSKAMRAAGVVSRSIPGENLLYKVFNTVGETLPSMALARGAATFAKGKSQAAFQGAAESAAESLVALVQPLAAPLFDEHRAAGRPVVLATTTPYDLVRPFADLLGLDDVVATMYGIDQDGNYDGSLVGPFVWNAGKLSAVRDWANRHGYDLAHSFAYSDSVYDTPLLAAVGHPFVVNPDPRMRLMARARRWPVLDLSGAKEAQEAARATRSEIRSDTGDDAAAAGRSTERRDGSEMARLPGTNVDLQQLTQQLTHPFFFPYARFDIAGTENIPRRGPAIIVGNHRSYFDSAAMAVTLAQVGRPIRFLGKKEVFDAPVVGQLAKAMGGIRVDRGTGSDEPLKAAAEALENGDLVALMPQGTIPRGRAFFDPQLQGRWGAARLAAMTHAPVIPVGLWGTEKVWPRSARLPAVLNVVTPPTIRVRVGKPVPLKYRDPDKDTQRIMQALMDLLPEESRVEREPTHEELMRALPPGYKGDPNATDKELRRRPGTDI